MRGLRKREENNFENFFEVVEACARKENSVFFLDCGEGRDVVEEGLSGEDLSGWLIPDSRADEFEKAFLANDIGPEWSDFIVFAIWSFGKNQKVTVNFKKF